MIGNQKGNVFVYILIAVGLLGALMFALSKSASQSDAGAELSDGENKIIAGEIIAYAASASNALSQMQQTGATINMVDFMLPSDTHFNDAPTVYKLFHPDGGGLNYKAIPAKAIVASSSGLAPGYYVGRFNNIEWTPTTAQDVVFAAYKLKKGVCEELNRKVAATTTIPTVSAATLPNLFVFDDLHSGTNADFNKVNCAACEEVSALCVTDGTDYVFYSILEAE